MLALAHSTVNDVWITRMRFIFIDNVGGARGTLFTERDIIHSDNVMVEIRKFKKGLLYYLTKPRLHVALNSGWNSLTCKRANPLVNRIS